MFNVRPRDGLGVFTVISDYYGDIRIVSSHAVDEILKLVIPKESLCRNRDEGTDIILYKDGRSDNCYPYLKIYLWYMYILKGFKNVCFCFFLCLQTLLYVLPSLDPVLYSLGVTP